MLSPEELESLAQEHGLLVSDAPPAAPPPPDYEALAQKHGLLVSDAPPAAPPPPDYEALAQKHGLVLSDRPPRGRPAIQPDYEALAKQHGLIIRDPIPGVDEPIRGLEKLGGRLPGAGAPPRLQMETPTIFRMMGGEKRGQFRSHRPRHRVFRLGIATGKAMSNGPSQTVLWALSEPHQGQYSERWMM